MVRQFGNTCPKKKLTFGNVGALITLMESKAPVSNNVSKAEIKGERNTCQNKLQVITEKIVKEKEVNCEQCGKQFSGKKYLEEHRTIVHDSPEEDYSGKQAEIKIGKNIWREYFSE